MAVEEPGESRRKIGIEKLRNGYEERCRGVAKPFGAKELKSYEQRKRGKALNGDAEDMRVTADVEQRIEMI